MPPRLYVPLLIAGMIITVCPFRYVLPLFTLTLPSRAPATPCGQSTRYVSPLHFTLILMCLRVQDMQCVENCDDPNPSRRVLYEQPVWQTLQMFRASSLTVFSVCILITVTSRRNALSVLLFHIISQDLYLSCPSA